MSKFKSRVRFSVFAVSALAVMTAPSSQSSAGSLPERVQAVYDIHFNGFQIGTYEFRSQLEGSSYQLQGNANLSLLLGAIQWSGVIHSTGRLAGDNTRPSAFNFEYTSTLKNGSTRMAFSGDQVTQVLHQPPSPVADNTVPVQPQHLKGVMDPMTAVLAMARGDGDPCSRRLPIYDGKQRFDLVLSPKGQVRIGENAGAIGVACRVRYIPIAGHKADKDTQHLSQSNGIEVVMTPVDGAPLHIPYKVTIPTAAGPATLTSRRVVLTQHGQQRLAFAQQ